VAKVLHSIRFNEQVRGTINGIFGAAYLGGAGVLTYYGGWFQAIMPGLIGATYGLQSVGYFYYSDVPKFEDFIGERRNQLKSWEKGSDFRA